MSYGHKTPGQRDYYFFAVSDDILAQYPAHGMTARILENGERP
jgi:hypothetical protein